MELRTPPSQPKKYGSIAWLSKTICPKFLDGTHITGCAWSASLTWCHCRNSGVLLWCQLAQIALAIARLMTPDMTQQPSYAAPCLLHTSTESDRTWQQTSKPSHRKNQISSIDVLHSQGVSKTWTKKFLGTPQTFAGAVVAAISELQYVFLRLFRAYQWRSPKWQGSLPAQGGCWGATQRLPEQGNSLWIVGKSTMDKQKLTACHRPVPMWFGDVNNSVGMNINAFYGTHVSGLSGVSLMDIYLLHLLYVQQHLSSAIKWFTLGFPPPRPENPGSFSTAWNCTCRAIRSMASSADQWLVCLLPGSPSFGWELAALWVCLQVMSNFWVWAESEKAPKIHSKQQLPEPLWLKPAAEHP